ncbi:hypothetical protein LBMAG48_10880 [Phycisphaerae bacterium]|nr:hypothetical protein LBMAG48_10880 [Phycisphaerae bacterium]
MNQSTPRSKSVLVGLTAGIALTALAGMLMGQGASQPVKSEPQYFVTADGDGAHLWVREGTALRVVAHGECKECAAKGHDDHDHKEGDGHDHAKPAPKK